MTYQDWFPELEPPAAALLDTLLVGVEVPDVVTVDGAMTISVVTPAVTVDKVVAPLEPVVAVVPAAQNPSYQFSMSWRSLSAGQ